MAEMQILPEQKPAGPDFSVKPLPFASSNF
jgi:hypothetical protein